MCTCGSDMIISIDENSWNQSTAGPSKCHPLERITFRHGQDHTWIYQPEEIQQTLEIHNNLYDTGHVPIPTMF